MKAIVYQKYGSPDVLELQEIEKPAVTDGELLVRIHAASVNPLDWHFMRGAPLVVRAMAGLLKPKRKILGADFAGRVEEVGGKVTQFQPGDEVFGSGNPLGAFAEYLCVPEDRVVLKPANLTHEEAASVPVAALTALQGLRDKGKIQPGHNALINGASGGVGTFAVQIAKSFGAEVTGVCSTRNLDMVRSIGADRVVNYSNEDFTRTGVRYDLIFDLVGNRSGSDYKRALQANGIYVAAGGGSVVRTQWMVMTGGKNMVSMFTKPNREDMGFIRELLEAGKVTPVIDRRYKLSEVPAALRYLEEGHAQGKVVITV